MDDVTSGGPAVLARTAAFRTAFARRQAERVVEVPGGFAVLHDRFLRSQEHNQLVVDGEVRPEALPELAGRLLGHLPYRRITVYDDALGRACEAPLLRAGYVRAGELVMVHLGTPPALARHVRAVPAEALRAPYLKQVRVWMEGAEPEELRQLADRRTLREKAADSVRFLAAHTARGEIASWADLYVDRAAGVAQIEDLITADLHTGRGHADAVVGTALRLAADEGCGLRFLLAAEDDWPRHWYGRLGFEVIGLTHVYTARGDAAR